MNDQLVDELIFTDEAEDRQKPLVHNKWKVMIVDDEPDIHEMTAFAFSNFTYMGVGVEFISAYSGAEAMRLILQHPDTALIFLDVVMERDDSGLTVAKFIRNEVKNLKVKIILRTGQPGQAPEQEVIVAYDINDYKEKHELTDKKLNTVLVTSLRSYSMHETLEQFNFELEKKVAERTIELKAAKESADKANLEKTDFLNFVAHELRTPLTSLRGFISIISDRFEAKLLPLIDTTDKKIQKAISNTQEEFGIMKQEGERLSALINNVLDLAKIEAGRVEWAKDKVDMAEIFKRAAFSTNSLFTDKGLELKTEIQGDGYIITGDTDRLIQVVINLFSNAIKFTDSGNITYKIMRDNKGMRCEIHDTGCGIPKEYIGKVFEKFQQVASAQTNKPKGTGLGLPICKEIIKYHGGDIWAESEEGVGSRFIFLLPLDENCI
jgi:signal transduction histidine kinase